MIISWLDKLWLTLFPDSFLKSAIKKQGLDSRKLDWAVWLLGGSKRIDLSRTAGPGRGFILTLDNKLSLFFYQDGDHFSFDGYEIGDYENGQVTIFDSIKNPKDKEYKELMKWLGEFDPEEFDAQDIHFDDPKKRLKELFK